MPFVVERPLFSTSMEAFGSSIPTTDDMSTEGGNFKIDEPNALPTPCEMVSIASTETDIPKMSRLAFSGIDDTEKPFNPNDPY